MMLVLLIGAVLAIVVFHIFVFHQYNFPWTARIIDRIPGPGGDFFFGSTMKLWNTKNEDRLEEFSNMFKEYGSTFRLWFSGVPTIFISELDDYQTVLGSRLDSSKGIMYKHILQWLGRGLLTSSGNKWHQRRKIITPAFHFSILQGFVQVFNRNIEILNKKLFRASQEGEVNLSTFITRCTLDNVCETAMGTQINSQGGEHNGYVSAVFRMGAIVAERLFSPVLFPDANFAISKVGREHKQLLDFLHRFTENVIRECSALHRRLKSAVENKKQQDDIMTGIYSTRLTFLQLLLEKRHEYGLSDNDIREEVDTFMFEGHDTTSMGLTWTLMELGFHSEIQKKCYEEQVNIFGSSDRCATYKDIMAMEYLKRVVQESLRLHPSVPIISRKFDKDLQLKNYLVPAHTEIVMSLYHLHRNPKTFPNPTEFNPDRFLPEAVEQRHRFAYLPFSAGLRNCVGQKFAMLEMLLILSSIIRNFQITTLGDRKNIKAVPEMTLRPANSIKWRITPRNGNCNGQDLS